MIKIIGDKVELHDELYKKITEDREMKHNDIGKVIPKEKFLTLIDLFFSLVIYRANKVLYNDKIIKIGASKKYINKLKQLLNKFDNGKKIKIDDLELINNRIALSCEIYDRTKELIIAENIIDNKDSILINYEYFLKNKIDKLNNDFITAINSFDIEEMKRIFDMTQIEIIDEWKKFFEQNSSCFIGCSLRRDLSDVESVINRKFISCSLFNQNCFETFNEGFGFVYAPEKIVAASSHDLVINNYAKTKENLSCNKVIQVIDHPKRIIDECMEKINNNINNGSNLPTYSEIVLEDAIPIAIFCFVGDELFNDSNYKSALELKRLFPNLNINSIVIPNYNDIKNEKKYKVF